MNQRLNISRVEDWLYGLIQGRVSERVYPGGLPSMPEGEWRDMVTIEIDSSTDITEYGRGMGVAMAVVTAWVKPASNGEKDVAWMARIEGIMAEIWAEAKGDGYSASELYAVSGYSREAGCHYTRWMVQVRIY